MQDCFVSAGVYIINPEVLGKIPAGQYCDMPDLITQLSSEGLFVTVFPIGEYWLDIGCIEDLEKAHVDYAEFFDSTMLVRK